VAQLSTAPATWLSTAPGFPRQLGHEPSHAALLLADDGELQMLVEGQLSWSSGTGGRGYGPFRLHVSGPAGSRACICSRNCTWTRPPPP
jgi:hypothetical protein